MKTEMFVLLSAAVLLLQPHEARSKALQPRHHLRRILDLAEDCNASLIEVNTHLVPADSRDTFLPVLSQSNSCVCVCVLCVSG